MGPPGAWVGAFQRTHAMDRSVVAAAVQHVLLQCGAACIKDIADLIEDGDSRADILSVLRSDACRAAVEAAAAAQVARDSAPARTVATVGTMTDAVATRDVGSLATFSLATGARMVSSEVQCSVRMVQRAMQATRDVSDASVGATVSTEDASTSHYLVLGIGSAREACPAARAKPTAGRAATRAMGASATSVC